MAYFDKISKVVYEGRDAKNIFAYRYYNPEETVMGRKMKDHLRFAICYWHTMIQDGSDPFGYAVNRRNWFGATPMETARNRIEAFFELLVKLGVEFFCFHDVDIAPTGGSLGEFFENLDEMTGIIRKKMDETGIKLLWNTANMFSAPRFVNGAASSNNAEVFAYAAAQVKKGLDISRELGGKNYVFWGGREGYESLLNTDMGFELDNIARFFKMAVKYAEGIGHKPVFLLEPKPKEPMKHQYDYDAATTEAFLLKYGLSDDFKLNIEANHAIMAGHTFDHELNVARVFGALGSIDANQGDYLLGWDTDEFPTNIMDVTLAMYQILLNGGIEPGGINFDAKVRRSSFEQEDLAFAHIAGMDTFARGLEAAARMIEDGFLEGIKGRRYASYKEGIGKSILEGKEDLKSLAEYSLKHGDDIRMESGRIEYVKSVLNDYIFT